MEYERTQPRYIHKQRIGRYIHSYIENNVLFNFIGAVYALSKKERAKKVKKKAVFEPENSFKLINPLVISGWLGC